MTFWYSLYLLGQFGFSLFCNGRSNLKSTVPTSDKADKRSSTMCVNTPRQHALASLKEHMEAGRSSRLSAYCTFTMTQSTPLNVISHWQLLGLNSLMSWSPVWAQSQLHKMLCKCTTAYVRTYCMNYTLHIDIHTYVRTYVDHQRDAFVLGGILHESTGLTEGENMAYPTGRGMHIKS